MKKRPLLALLLMLPIISHGCTKSDDNTAQNGGANYSNANRPAAGANTNSNGSTDSLTPRTKEDKSIAVVVYHDGAGATRILVVPDPIKLSKGKGQKLRFHVFNDTDVNFSKVEFAFADDPFDGALNVGAVAAGDDEGGATRRIKAAAAFKKYKYSIKVFGPDPTKPPIAELDPEVEIAT